MRRVRVGRPILGKTVGLVAVRSLREIVAMPVGMRVRDHKRALDCFRAIGRRAFCGECLTADVQAAHRSDDSDRQSRVLELF